jgi:hypothetical protein
MRNAAQIGMVNDEMALHEGLPLNPITCAEAWTGVADCLNCKIRQSVLFAHLTEADFRDPISSITRPAQLFTGRATRGYRSSPFERAL